MLVGYLNNPSEEAIFGSNRIRSNMKQLNFKMKTLCSALKHLKPWLMNSTHQPLVLKWETSQKKLFVLYSCNSILSNNIAK